MGIMEVRAWVWNRRGQWDVTNVGDCVGERLCRKVGKGHVQRVLTLFTADDQLKPQDACHKHKNSRCIQNGWLRVWDNQYCRYASSRSQTQSHFIETLAPQNGFAINCIQGRPRGTKPLIQAQIIATTAPSAGGGRAAQICQPKCQL